MLYTTWGRHPRPQSMRLLILMSLLLALLVLDAVATIMR